MDAKLMFTYSYRNQKCETVFKCKAPGPKEADELFKQATGKDFKEQNGLTCDAEVEKES